MTSSVTPLEEHITCSVCLDIYTDPHALKCLHTYCYQCIQQLQDPRARIVCPDCRKICNLTDVQKNFTTQSLVDLHSKAKKEASPVNQTVCEVCSELGKMVQSFCTDCNEFLCTDCHKAHQGSKLSRNHNLRPVTELCQPKQAEIQKEIEKIQEEKEDIGWKRKRNQEIITEIRQEAVQQMKEIRSNKEALMSHVESYHNRLLHKVACVNEDLAEKLQQSDQMFQTGETKLANKIQSLSDLSQSKDYSLLTETLETLSEENQAELEGLRSDLPELDPDLTSPVRVEMGKDWQPQQSLSIHLQTEAMPQKRPTTRAQVFPRYELVTSVDIECWPRKLCLSNHKLWIAGGYKGVFVCNEDCDQIKQIPCKQLNVVTGLACTPTGELIVCDRHTGLHRLNQHGDYLQLLHSGSFSDVSVHKDKLYALNYKQCQVWVFHRDSVSKDWVKDTGFCLRHTDGHMSDRLCASSVCLYVSSFNNHVVHVYSLGGEFWFKTGAFGDGQSGLFRNPLLCDFQSASEALVCDWRNHRLQALDAVDVNWRDLSVPMLRYPVSAEVSAKHLWIGTVPSLFGPRKLLKYKQEF